MNHQDLNSPRDAIQQEFLRYHEANPNVFFAIMRLARKQKASGSRGSINLIFEELRGKGFGSLNNDYRSRYARLVNKQKGFDEFFEVRPLRAEMGPRAVIQRAA